MSGGLTRFLEFESVASVVAAVAGTSRCEGIELCCAVGDFVEVRQEVVAAAQEVVGGLVFGMIEC